MWQTACFCQNPQIFSPIMAVLRPFLAYKDWPCRADLQQSLDERDEILLASGKVLWLSDNVTGDYETHLYETGGLPTREHNWHDFLNLLVWQSFPRLKAQINAMHYEEKQKNSSKQRNTRQNRLTQFDESGVIVLSAYPEYEALLKAHDWKTLFVRQRESVQAQTRYFLFGHGKYEQMMSPFIGLTGKAIVLACDASLLQESDALQQAYVDEHLAEHLAAFLKVAMLPLPLLGIPGWYEENQSPTFYDNKAYFR